MTGQRSLFKQFMLQWELQLFVLIPLMILFVFQYIPMWGVLTAFQDFNLHKGFLGSEWVGLKHFYMFFNAPDFWQIMRNTIAISFLKLLIGFPAPIILALMLNEIRHAWFKRWVQTISYLPHFMSWVIISGMVVSILSVDNGSLNLLLEKLNVIDEPISWLSLPEYFWTILVTTGIWKEIGFGAIIYLAAISGVDQSMYEAAHIDGASRLKQIVYITIPSIAPIIIIFLILDISKILNAGFEDILLLTNQGQNAVLRPVSEVIDTYVYRVGIENMRYSYATAAGLFKAVVSVALLVIANSIARRLGSSLW
ncbi:ABC transporter permease [Paenibacillus sp. J5C2022]|uniref:ABC transporter permease n=1 Tax=Paenibacillus sp. J5C2022 TaxID=2977129 RepID=UPI003978031C